MNLYIHFGIYKAGSSYLQYICANRREELQQSGIWFPDSKDDEKMLRGSISSGNAFELSEWIKNEDFTKIEEYLVLLSKEAKSRNCDSVLLSAEALVHQFAQSERLKLFADIPVKAGFTKVFAMAYFRDLVDHCISLYKHRSKAGKNPDFEYWVKEKYETPHVLNNFFTNYNSVNFQWTFKKFKKDSAYMLSTFFDGWLGVNLKHTPAISKVNESITLSEIRVMQAFSKIYPNTAGFLLERFLVMPKTQKANDFFLEMTYRSKASKILGSIYQNDLSNWNTNLKNEELTIKSYTEPSDEEYAFVSLSSSQFKEILEASKYLNNWQSLAFRSRKFIARLIPKKVRHSLISKKWI